MREDEREKRIGQEWEREKATMKGKQKAKRRGIRKFAYNNLIPSFAFIAEGCNERRKKKGKKVRKKRRERRIKEKEVSQNK